MALFGDLADNWLALVTLVVASITAITLGWLDLRRKLRQQHEQMNSRMDQLIEATRAAAEAKGRADERAEAPRSHHKKPPGD